MRIRVRLPIAAALALAGCATPPPPSTAVQVRDDGVFLPSVRLVAPGSSGDADAGAAFELDAVTGRGAGAQNLIAGQPPVLLGGVAFNGPARAEYDFRFYQVQAVLRGRFPLGEAKRAGVEALIGSAFTNLDLGARAPGLSAREDVSSLALTLGVGGYWKPWPSTALEGRVTLNYPFINDVDDLRTTRIELAAVQSLGRHVSLRAGWAWWEIRSNSDYERSALRLRFSGPALGLGLTL